MYYRLYNCLFMLNSVMCGVDFLGISTNVIWLVGFTVRFSSTWAYCCCV